MQLHLQVKQQAAIIEAYELMVNDLKRYIGSTKFTHNPLEGVNPDDIFLRLREGENYIQTISED